MDPENEDNYKGDALVQVQSIRKFTKQKCSKTESVKKILKQGNLSYSNKQKLTTKTNARWIMGADSKQDKTKTMSRFEMDSRTLGDTPGKNNYSK
jgi:hypothetical protein